MNSTATFYPAPGDMPFSSAVRAGGFLMLSGQIPFGEDKRPLTGPIEEQTHAVLKAIAARLEAVGSSLDDVVKANIWLSDLAHFDAFNKVYASYFKEGRYPVRSLVQAQLVFGVGVEIEVQALDKTA
ncbi:RidA family protein [Comamonas resistens]|uniref:RidA family protein n=1 Tax=Comamonas resistens TaxID=3046670 RepID=A0ABY8SN28_9BURK|nr:RidA family protein [Comamonas resistens]MDL5038344.1 RidA family protein [Comamonas resistens]WHS64499.1 RidA family protein [Comamonas resistens]